MASVKFSTGNFLKAASIRIAQDSFGFLVFLIFFLISFREKISWRGGYDWDELWLVKAASMGNFSSFLNSMWVEPTPPIQALIFRISVGFGLLPIEQNLRFLNIVGWFILFSVTWVFVVKYKMRLIFIISMGLISMNWYPLSYVAQSRPYFFGFFLMFLFCICWFRDFVELHEPSRLLLLITLFASSTHVYGAIVASLVFFFWSLNSRRIFWFGLLCSVIPYAMWIFISISKVRDKVARAAWMEIPDTSELVTHIRDQLFGGSLSSYILLIGLVPILLSMHRKLVLGKPLGRVESAQIILVFGFSSTLVFAYLGTYIQPIWWYPRNFLFALPLAILASAIGYKMIFSYIRGSRGIGGISLLAVSGLLVLGSYPLVKQALFDPNKGMSQGNYRDTSLYATDFGFLSNQTSIIGWEDTQIYEFYFSRLGIGGGLELNYESRFASMQDLAQKKKILILASDGMVDTDYISGLEQNNFTCKSTIVLKGNIVECYRKLL